MDLLAPKCPRCAYDLSGAMAAWPKDACPMDCTCSECGLKSLCRDVLNPVYATSDLFFETAHEKLVRVFLRTWRQSLLPWRLWRGVRMQFELRPARLAVFVILAVALLWLLGAAADEVFSFLPVLSSGAILGPYQTSQTTVFWPVCREVWWPGVLLSDVLPSWLALGWAWLLLTPLLFALVPQTLRRARVRRSHLLRIWAYSLVGAPFLLYAPPLCDHLLGLSSGASNAVLRLLEHRGVLALVILATWGAWIALCWGAAAKHYLRLPRPWLVAIVLVSLGGLAVVTIITVGAALSSDFTKWLMEELR